MRGQTEKKESAEIIKVPIQKDNVMPEPGEDFVNTPYIKKLTERARAYLEVGYPVHFSGPAGTGKTTLAFHLAAQLNRPVALIHGDDEFGSSDLVGRDSGYRKSRVVDNYIHSVVKMEESMNSVWVDSRLTTACQSGSTLIYDEFTRSRPEANNALLSVLEEKILNLPKLRNNGKGYLSVHPEFRAIFTSNPEEYAGVHKTQDALMDRLITINLSHFDRETEIGITMAKSGMDRDDVEILVDIVRELRDDGVNNNRPTIRAIIAMARILVNLERRPLLSDPIFYDVCHDVLNNDTIKINREGRSIMSKVVDETIRKVIGGRKQKRVIIQPISVVDKMGV